MLLSNTLSELFSSHFSSALSSMLDLLVSFPLYLAYQIPSFLQLEAKTKWGGAHFFPQATRQ